MNDAGELRFARVFDEYDMTDVSKRFTHAAETITAAITAGVESVRNGGWLG